MNATRGYRRVAVDARTIAKLSLRGGEGVTVDKQARNSLMDKLIQQAVWLYFRFALSYRDVEDMLAERGIQSSFRGRKG